MGGDDVNAEAAAGLAQKGGSWRRVQRGAGTIGINLSAFGSLSPCCSNATD